MSVKSENSREALLERALRVKRAAARSKTEDLPRRPSDEPARLGETQRGLWLLHEIDPGSVAYNLASALPIQEPLDPGRLEVALRRLAARHRILTSTFETDGGEVRQRFGEPGSLRVETLDVEGRSLDQAAIGEARVPFDLRRGPLLRLVLLRDGGGGQLLLFCLHHIICDERSLDILWRDLAADYAEPSRETPEQPQFDDFVAWNASRPRSAASEELDFWRSRLDPAPETLTLPIARPAGGERDAAPTPGAFLKRPLDARAARAVRELSAELSTTPYAVFAYTFRLLLQRYASGERFAFGTPVSLRRHPATGRMVGYFLNPLVVPTSIDEDEPVDRSLARFASELRELTLRSAVPFDQLVESLAPSRDPGSHPLFQFMFVYQEGASPVAFGTTPMAAEPISTGEPKFDLTLFASRSSSERASSERASPELASPERGSSKGADAESFEIAVEYKADLYPVDRMERLLAHYEELLAGMGLAPQAKAGEVGMLLPGEETRLHELATGPLLVGSRPRPVAVEIFEACREHPDREAVRCGEISWTYEELGREASRIAFELTQRGLGRGDRVALHLERSPWMIAAILGVHWAGAAYVPLDPNYPEARNRTVLRDADVGAVLSTDEQGVPDGLLSIALHGIDRDGEATLTPPELRDEDSAYLLYTSGSTGDPKGVVVSHGNLASSTAARSEVYDRAPQRFLLLPSIAFDSSIAGIFWTLSTGGALVVPDDETARDPIGLAALIEREAIDSLLCVPSLYGHLLEAESARLTTLETAIVAGEACPAGLIGRHFAALPRTRLFNEYGPTEATVWASVTELEAGDSAEAIVPIGRPIPGVTIDVVDSRGRPRPEGLTGEAVISGPTVASGYWRRDAMTSERFAADRSARGRSYRTGDSVAWARDGRLQFLGRTDDQVKLRGFRIELGDVEAAMLELEEVAEAAVLVAGGGAEGGHRQLIGFARPASGSGDGLAAEVLRSHLGRRLPDFMVPSRLVLVDEMPYLPNGKVDRGALRELVLADPSSSERPASDLERGLAVLWEGLLRRSGIGRDDNFFELGGHSLLVLQMVRSIERDHGVELTAGEIFQSPTVRQLAARIEGAEVPEARDYANLFPLQPIGDERPLIVSIPHFFSGMLVERFRGRRPVYGLRGIGLRPEGNLGRWATMEDLAADLVEEVTRRFPDGDCIMAGYSFGASMAASAVLRMEALGLPVRRLVLVAPMALNIARVGPLHVEVGGLRRPLDGMSRGELLSAVVREYNPLSLRPYRRVWRYVRVQPKRRWLYRLGKARRDKGLPLSSEILHADVRIERFRLHRDFRPRGIQTPTTLFASSRDRTDVAATWRAAFDGPLEIVEIPDPHWGTEALEEAKETLREHIDQLERT